jgi:hypothetical protein
VSSAISAGLPHEASLPADGETVVSTSRSSSNLTCRIQTNQSELLERHPAAKLGQSTISYRHSELQLHGTMTSCEKGPNQIRTSMLTRYSSGLPVCTAAFGASILRQRRPTRFNSMPLFLHAVEPAPKSHSIGETLWQCGHRHIDSCLSQSAKAIRISSARFTCRNAERGRLRHLQPRQHQESRHSTWSGIRGVALTKDLDGGERGGHFR